MVDSKFTVEEEPLSPTARLLQQPNLNNHIIAVLGMGKKIDLEKFKDGLESTFVQHSRFSSILVSHGRKKPIWVRTKVVIDEHIVVPDMNLETATNSPDKHVEDYVSSLSTCTMDISRPLWEMHLLNIRTSDEEAVAVLRVHHSVGDGVSLISLLLASSRKISDQKSLPTVQVAKGRTPSKHHCISAFLLRFWALLVLVWHSVVDIILFMAASSFSQDTKTLLKGTDGVEFRQKRFVYRSVSLDDVKAIKNAVGSALILHFLSYMNKLTMVVAVDELTIPDPHRLLDDLAESLKQIKDAVTTNA